MTELEDQIKKAEEVANQHVTHVEYHERVPIFVLEDGGAVLLESGTLPNAIFATVEDAKRNISHEGKRKEHWGSKADTHMRAHTPEIEFVSKDYPEILQ